MCIASVCLWVDSRETCLVSMCPAWDGGRCALPGCFLYFVSRDVQCLVVHCIIREVHCIVVSGINCGGKWIIVICAMWTFCMSVLDMECAVVCIIMHCAMCKLFMPSVPHVIALLAQREAQNQRSVSVGIVQKWCAPPITSEHLVYGALQRCTFPLNFSCTLFRGLIMSSSISDEDEF